MTEQERALWAAVYVALAPRLMDAGACKRCANDAVRDLRASEAALAAESKAAEEALRGEPPFKAGDVVTFDGSSGSYTVTHVFWAAPGHWTAYSTDDSGLNHTIRCDALRKAKP